MAIDFLCEDMKCAGEAAAFADVKGRIRNTRFEVMNRFIEKPLLRPLRFTAENARGDRDLAVLINPLPREKRAKKPKGAKNPRPCRAARRAVRRVDASGQVGSSTGNNLLCLD
jgi:hypothetical protein